MISASVKILRWELRRAPIYGSSAAPVARTIPASTSITTEPAARRRGVGNRPAGSAEWSPFMSVTWTCGAAARRAL
ncbi:MAG: hypothetical protein ACLPKB_28260 [Xanthobacteraceae bacterium]